MNCYFLRYRITPFVILLISISIFLITTSAIVIVNDNETYTKDVLTDSLPHVFNENNGELVESNLRHEAVLKFALYQLPQSEHEWSTYRVQLKDKIIKMKNVL